MIEADPSVIQESDEENVTRGSVRGFRPSYLRNAREAAGMSIETLGMRAGVVTSTIAHWEGSRRRPTPEALAAVARVLGLTIADLAPIKQSDLRPVDLRNRVGLTQAAVGAAVGISDATLGAIERGVRPPAEEVYPALAELYEVSVDVLKEVWQRYHDTRVSDS